MTTPGPDTAPDAPEPAQADTGAREELRDRIEAALDTHRWTKVVDIGPHSRHGYHALCKVCTGDVGAMADAVLPVVEAAAVKQRERADQAEQEADTWRAAAQAANASTHAAEVRARHAEDERDTWRSAAEQAEAAVQRVRPHLADAIAATWEGMPEGDAVRKALAALDQEAGQ